VSGQPLRCTSSTSAASNLIELFSEKEQYNA
jgi:hypothetical protein